ncbi:hypothetical protein EV659_103116 [Rhodothalassium salexigens DSM 2132]|uniref:UPF0235 protein EV659_103116 n=1 Tax=Rhodothalassium salexigens DSM 2132 TaxID=1188247 RepID=A0A4R2PKW5_RHOSA|nr:DUF167 domain-containing protein [Rhodothalassium salexigens]MBB4211115.1 hypothetical protein [Rhodothalassium salexigens DSM 2132]TCP36229.1 hypothetical protein EV659_103116 [Rhodothalassium salexigens DSM 2132]
MTDAGADGRAGWAVLDGAATRAEGGLRLRVKLTPKAGRTGIQGVETTAQGPALKVQVTAVPEKGRANAALTAFLAKRLGLAKRDVTLEAGATSRHKTVFIVGAPDALAPLLESTLRP